MKCPKCNEEIDDNASFCQSCGEKLNKESSINCPKCGEILKSNVNFCSNCGYNFKTGKNISDITYRSPEFILGMVGSAIGVLLYFIGHVEYMIHECLLEWPLLVLIQQITLLISVIIAPLIGFISTWYLQKNNRVGAIGMLVSSLLFLYLYLTLPLVSRDLYAISCFIIGLGALLVLFKK